MGKTTGFMDYTRKTSTDVPPLERIENFNEFHVWLSREEQQTQAARRAQLPCAVQTRRTRT